MKLVEFTKVADVGQLRRISYRDWVKVVIAAGAANATTFVCTGREL